MIGTKVVNPRLLRGAQALRLFQALSQTRVPAAAIIPSLVYTRLNSSATPAAHEALSEVIDSTPPTTKSSNFNKRRPRNKPNRSGMFQEERQALSAKYAEVENLLNKNNVAEATALFSETYKPEQSNAFRYYGEEDGTPLRLAVKLFKHVLKAHQSGEAEGVIPLRELFGKYLDGKMIFGWMCYEVIFYELSQGNTGQGLEAWIKFWEAIGDTSKVRQLENREAAHAALIAYIATCLKENSTPVAKVALYMVPLENVPDDNDIRNMFRGAQHRFDEEFISSVLEGVKSIRYDALNPADVDYLNSLPVDRPLELESRYAECKQKAEMSQTPLPESTYARFIFCFAESGRVQQAFDVWNDLTKSGIVPSVQSWNNLLKAGALSKNQSIAVTEGIFAKMEENGVTPNADSYGSLIDIYFKGGQSETAIEIFEKIQKGEIAVNTNLKIFNVMLNGLLNSGMEEMARNLLTEGIQQGLSPDVIAFNTFIKTYIKLKKFNEVEEMLNLMVENGVTPNVATYTNVIDSMYKASNSKNVDSFSYIEALVKDMNKNGIRTNTSTITAIIDGLGKSGAGSKVINDVYELMKRKRLRPNLRTFTALINGEFISGNTEQAAEYFKQIGQYNLSKPIASYNQMIKGFADRGLLDKALEYFRMAIKDNRVQLNRYTYTFVLQACVNARDFEEAREALKVLSKEPDNFLVGRPLAKLLHTLESEGLKVPKFAATRDAEAAEEGEANK